jgi:alanyl-tRNA synthetase
MATTRCCSRSASSAWTRGPELARRVREVLGAEERRFRQLLDRGRLVLAGYRGQDPLSEEDLRYLHQTHGLPPGPVSLLRSQE